MAKFGKQELWQATSCLLCIAMAWARLDDVGASEFSGAELRAPCFEWPRAEVFSSYWR